MNSTARSSTQLSKLKANAGKAADFLLLLSNDKRLLVLCELLTAKELSVNDLAERVELSQSALSQHLARLRAEGLVETRRDAQTIYYRLVKDERVVRTLALLQKLFCR
jgi:ArsR family transcriptional regulator, virulence genes transcriptional regulator